MNSKYSETIEYLYSAAPAFEKVGAGAYKEGLSNTRALDEHFQNPHHKFLTIHIGGTNGKGSCSHTLAAVLQAAGYKVGLYTSPHLVDFRERIRVNGECIPEQYVIDFVEVERNFFEPLQPSFFELTTALAFKYFADQNVDVAIIEVGLGGRLDCTNIITPLISLITNISLDHTQFLGNTLAQIASEKAGIIKQGVPVVIGEYTPETRPVFEAKAAEVAAPVVFAEDEAEIETLWHDLDFELKGDYQAKNRRTILTALSVLRHLHDENAEKQPLTITDEAIRHGFANVAEMTGLMGRWQKLQERPLVICDAGHNIGGWQYLHKQIKDTFRNLQGNTTQTLQPTLRIVFGMVDDKDIDAVMGLMPDYATYYFCQASTKRAVKSNEVKRLAEKHSLQGRAFPTVESAYRAAIADAETCDFVFVGGSCYVLADLLSTIDIKGK